MRVDASTSLAQVGRVLRRCLEEGRTVEIDGLGVFRPAARGRFRFEAFRHSTVFIAYVEEDFPAADLLYRALECHGLHPWMDKYKLLPGQNWPRAIEGAIERSDSFLPLFSARSVSKRGHFQAELRYALECAAKLPLDATYMMPLRLDDCVVPARIARQYQYVNLFPDWDRGVRRVLAALRKQQERTGPRITCRLVSS